MPTSNVEARARVFVSEQTGDTAVTDMISITQDPEEMVFYKASVANDVITPPANWSVTPADGVLDAQADTTTTSRIRLSGLTLGKKYTLAVSLACDSLGSYEHAIVIFCELK